MLAFSYAVCMTVKADSGSSQKVLIFHVRSVRELDSLISTLAKFKYIRQPLSFCLQIAEIPFHLMTETNEHSRKAWYHKIQTIFKCPGER